MIILALSIIIIAIDYAIRNNIYNNLDILLRISNNLLYENIQPFAANKNRKENEPQ
jgi:hypothetical protein